MTIYCIRPSILYSVYFIAIIYNSLVISSTPQPHQSGTHTSPRTTAQATDAPLTVPPVPLAPSPPALPTEQIITVINTTTLPMNIRFETAHNPSIIESIQPKNSKQITYKLGTLPSYSFEGFDSENQHLTPDKVSQSVATISLPPALQTMLTTPPTPTAPTPLTSRAPSAASLPTPPLPAQARPMTQPAASSKPAGYKAEVH